MSVNRLSFYQQNAYFWNRSQAETQSLASTASLITTMGNAVTNQAAGMASIANQQALTRVQNQLKDALKSALQTSTAGSSSSASAASTRGSPATGAGTVPLLASTSLLTLGIPASGAISVSDGTNTTTYTSTGTDTVGDLINALNNTTKSGNAQINAYLNTTGKLVLTAVHQTDSLSVSGLFAPNIGFGPKNSSFAPIAAKHAQASSSSSNTVASSTSSAANQAKPFNSSSALQTSSTAVTLLGSSISTGSSLNLLA